MIIFIKDNSLITEKEYTEEFMQLLIDEGYYKMEVDDGFYHYENFKKINGEWKFIVQELINELQEELAELD